MWRHWPHPAVWRCETRPVRRRGRCPRPHPASEEEALPDDMTTPTKKPKRQPHRPDQSVVSAGVDRELRERARTIAHDRDTTVSELIRGSLSATVARIELEDALPHNNDRGGRERS